jgi:Tol biopolymer transport system component
VVPFGINPVWSPNGQWIAFSYSGDIWKVEVNMAGVPQGAPVQITTGTGWKNQPSWSQNSKTIVFHSNLGGADFDIYTVPAASGTPTKLTGIAGYGDYDPSYSNNGKYVAFAGFNGEAPATKLAGGVTSQLLSAAVPQEFWLAQNYPNPFNPSTVIEYTLPEENFVTLSVYNSLGEEVAVLVRGVRSAGVNSVTFDAGKLPSGVYLYRLSAGSFVETRKLVLVK